jgi:hypothetical protein
MIERESKILGSPLFRYALPCTGRNLVEFERLKQEGKINGLDESSSIDDVREYFFGPHNRHANEGGNFLHMVLPYEIWSLDGGAQTKLLLPFHDLPESFYEKEFILPRIDRARGLGALEKISVGGIIIVHAGVVVDYAEWEPY